MFNAHIEILNHQEGFLSRINNQLSEQMKLCITLQCILQVEPSSFSGRCCVVPHISLNHSASSPSLVIMSSRFLSFQSLRPLVHDSDVIIHFYYPTTLYNTWCTLGLSKHLGENEWIQMSWCMFTGSVFGFFDRAK